MNYENEVWVDAFDHELYYSVSNLGRVLRKEDSKIIKPVLKKSSETKTLEIFLKNNKGIKGKKSPRVLIYKSFNRDYDVSIRLNSIDGDFTNLRLDNICTFDSDKLPKKEVKPIAKKTNEEMILAELKKINNNLKKLLNEK